MKVAVHRFSRLHKIAIALCVLLTADPSGRAESLHYPPPRRGDVVDEAFGTKIEDPYRWLEQVDSAETVDWVKTQSQLASDLLDHLPQRKPIQQRLNELWSSRSTDVPWREAGRIFFTESSGDQPQPILYVQNEAGDDLRKVLDPREISKDGSIAVGDYAVSPDGRWLAYLTSEGGGGKTEVHVRDLSTDGEQKDIVREARGGVCWTFDGGGYFYWRRPAESNSASTAARLEKQLFYHVLGQPQARDRPIHEWKDDRYLYAMMSDDGRYALAVTEQGSTSRMHLLDLRNALAPDLSAPLVRLLGNVEAGHTPMGTVGNTLYVFTDLDAPRGRVIALDLAEGEKAQPRSVIAESSDVIQWATVAGDRIAIHYLVDVKSRLALFTLDGEPAGEVALPGMGAIGWPMNGRNSAAELWYSFTSFLAPSTVYRFDLRSGENLAFRAPPVAFDATPYESRQVFFASKDGTRVPMFITARKSMSLDGSHPLFLTSYGANGIIQGPDFRPDVPLWLELGGIYAVANPRGGGEYGEEWHRAGNLEHKQNSIDDFIGAAEYLVEERYTSPGKIAIYGHSSGGLLIGAAMTQRPDLFGVALPDAGHYDMLRYHKFTVGAGWIPEYGSPEEPAAFQYLRAYSPLHNIRPDTCYPATMILTADHDDTVVPSHSYKYAAALQAVQPCDHPILLRMSRDASHSYASREEAIAKWADVWSFTAAQLGMPVEQALHERGSAE